MGKIYIGTDAASLTVSDAFEAYTGVKLHAGTVTQTGTDGKDYTVEVVYTAGNETGRVLEVSNPWGTQAMANSILALISGYRYQPYTATEALIDPIAEIGDSVQVNSVVGGITRQDITFGSLLTSEASAPHDEEIDHEYNYATSTDKALSQSTRSLMEVRASIIATIDGLEAEVVKQTGGSSASFGWYLKSDKFELKSGGSTVFKCDSTGITVSGNAEVSGDISCRTLTVGSTTYTSGTFDSILNAGINGGNSWGSGYSGGTYRSQTTQAYNIVNGVAVASLIYSTNLGCNQFELNNREFKGWGDFTSGGITYKIPLF